MEKDALAHKSKGLKTESESLNRDKQQHAENGSSSSSNVGKRKAAGTLMDWCDNEKQVWIIRKLEQVIR